MEEPGWSKTIPGSMSQYSRIVTIGWRQLVKYPGGQSLFYFWAALKLGHGPVQFTIVSLWPLSWIWSVKVYLVGSMKRCTVSRSFVSQ